MTLNHTLCHLLARRHEQMLCFSRQLTSGPQYLKCAGGESGDGLPLPKAARIYRLDCWDGVTLFSAVGNVSASQGSRISVYASPNGGVYDLTVRINGVDTALRATGIAPGATLLVTVHLQLI